MTDMTYDLRRESWIPCIADDGTPRVASLEEVLANAHSLREVFHNSPLVTVSLLRLLLAVLYRALDGPKTREEWDRLSQADRLPEVLIRAYLDRCEAQYPGCFDLFHRERPFYQIGGLEMDRYDSVKRLGLEILNSTIFDHRDQDGELFWPPDAAACMLVAAQSFSLGFGKSSNARVDGQLWERPYSADAIILRGLTVWLSSRSLRETLLLNLVPHDEFEGEADWSGDLPPWEQVDAMSLTDRMVKGKRQATTALGSVDRFTWQSRLIRLLPEQRGGQLGVRRLYFTQGREADKAPTDPMKAYVMDEKEGWSAVPLSAAKACWRDVHTLLLRTGPRRRQPLALQFAASLRELERLSEIPELHVVGIASAPNKAGKFLLWRHERMPLPPAYLAEPALVETLVASTKEAETLAGELRERTKILIRLYLAPDTNQPNGRKPDEKDVARLLENLDPLRPYWSRLELPYSQLMRDLAGEQPAAADRWHQSLRECAEEAYREVVALLGASVRLDIAAGQVSDYFAVPGPDDTSGTRKQTKNMRKKDGEQ